MVSSTLHTPSDLSLYGGADPRDQPTYTTSEISQATGVPISTVRAWFLGTTYGTAKPGVFSSVLSPPAEHSNLLSFNNLVEVLVLQSLRTGTHRVKMHTVREAIRVAAEHYGLDRPLLSPDLVTVAGKIFLDRYSEYLDLARHQQLAMRQALQDSIKRVGYDPDNAPVEFYPVPRRPTNGDRRLILVTPFVAFGRAVVTRIGVTTNAIASRIDVGEDAMDVKRDYGLHDDEFDEAIAYEAAA